jgi:hypothetical protein
MGWRRPPKTRSDKSPLLILETTPIAGNTATKSPLTASDRPSSVVKYDAPQLFTNRYSE